MDSRAATLLARALTGWMCPLPTVVRVWVLKKKASRNRSRSPGPPVRSKCSMPTARYTPANSRLVTRLHKSSRNAKRAALMVMSW